MRRGCPGLLRHATSASQRGVIERKIERVQSPNKQLQRTVEG